MEKFDSIAKDYDTDKRIQRAKVISDKIRSHVVPDKENTAMEFGCGTGLVGLELAPIFKSLLMVDASCGMIEQTKKKLNEMNLQTVTALCCDLTVSSDELPKFDYIFMSLVLHHIKDTEAILTRLHNMLNKGGHLLIVDLDKEDGSFHAKYPDFDRHNGFDQTELINLSKKAGCCKAEAETFYHGSKEFENRISKYSLFILDAEK